MKAIGMSFGTCLTALVALGLVSGSASANNSSPRHISVVPCNYDPQELDLSTGLWLQNIGLPDDKGDDNYGLLLSKNGKTPTNAAGCATIRGFEGQTVSELGFDLRNGGHCGAGAPRFDVFTQDKVDHFFGCAAGTVSVAPPTRDGATTGWRRVRFDPATGFPPIKPTDTIVDISLVFDEGVDTAPDFSGLAILDNIDVNRLVIGRPGNLQERSNTTVVSPRNMQGWGFYDDNTNGKGTGMMVKGPAKPPLGHGSARLFLTAATAPPDRQLLSTLAYAGTRLDSISTLQYSTYRSSTDTGNNLALTLQFDMDFNLTDADTSFQGRLVFEPYLTSGGGTVPTSVWQKWNPLAGKWYASRAPYSAMCPQSNPCTWSQVLTNWPDAGLRENNGLLHFKAGAPWPGFDGNVDAFTIGVQGGTITYDFEP